MHFSQLFQDFRCFASAERNLNPQTTKDILAIVRRLCVFLNTTEIPMVSTDEIRSFLYHGRENLRWSVRTFKLYRQYLKTFFASLVCTRKILTNPVAPIETPRLPDNPPRCLSHDESRKILKTTSRMNWPSELQRFRAEAIVYTFLMTGLRRSELLKLRIEDVDFKNGTIFVQEGKGKKSRTIPIHPRLTPMLQRYISEKHRTYSLSGWVFSSVRSDHALTSKNLYTVLRRISDISGIYFTPHILRHTFGRELVEADFNIYKLREVMGHASVETTQIYVALSGSSLKESFSRTKIY